MVPFANTNSRLTSIWLRKIFAYAVKFARFSQPWRHKYRTETTVLANDQPFLRYFCTSAIVCAKRQRMRWAAVALIVSIIFVAEHNESFAEARNASAKQKTIICAKPIFPGLHRLRDMLAEEPRKLESVTIVSLFLLKKYCAAINGDLTPTFKEKINQYCDMHFRHDSCRCTNLLGNMQGC